MLAGPAELVEPARLGDDLGRHPDHRPEVDLLRDLGAAPVPAHREGPVERGDQTLGAGGVGPLHALHHDVAVAGPVHLEEGARVGRHDLLDGLARRSWTAPSPSRGPPRPGRRRPLRRDGRPGRRSARSRRAARSPAPSATVDHRALGLLAGHVRGEAELARRPPRCRRPSGRARSRRRSAPYTGAGSLLRARCWATATDSNHGFCFHGFSNFTRTPRGDRRPGVEAGQRALGARADRWPVRGAGEQLEHHRLVAGRDGLRVVLARGRDWRGHRPASGSPYPCTHSGSGPSSGSPVKNLAAMQPPRQES